VLSSFAGAGAEVDAPLSGAGWVKLKPSTGSVSDIPASFLAKSIKLELGFSSVFILHPFALITARARSIESA
jgi:hypothetical protein